MLLKEVLEDRAVGNAANALHYLIVHAKVKQYYYELKYIRDEKRFLDLLGRGLKELEVLSGHEEHRADIEKLYLPSKEDITKLLHYYNNLKEKLTAALAAMSVALCPKCFARRGA